MHYSDSNRRQKHPMSVLLWVVCYSLEYWCRLLIQPRHEINLCGLTSLILIHLDATAGSNRNTLAYEQIDYSGSDTGRIVPARLESNSSTLSSTGNVKPLNLRCVWTLNHQRNFCSADRKWVCSKAWLFWGYALRVCNFNENTTPRRVNFEFENIISNFFSGL